MNLFSEWRRMEIGEEAWQQERAEKKKELLAKMRREGEELRAQRAKEKEEQQRTKETGEESS